MSEREYDLNGILAAILCYTGLFWMSWHMSNLTYSAVFDHTSLLASFALITKFDHAISTMGALSVFFMLLGMLVRAKAPRVIGCALYGLTILALGIGALQVGNPSVILLYSGFSVVAAVQTVIFTMWEPPRYVRSSKCQ